MEQAEPSLPLTDAIFTPENITRVRNEFLVTGAARGAGPSTTVEQVLAWFPILLAERDRYKAAIEKHRTLMLQAHDVHGGEPGLINTMLWDELGAPFRVKLLRGPVVVVEIEESDLTPVRLVELGEDPQ